MAGKIISDFIEKFDTLIYLLYAKKFLHLDGDDHVCFSAAKVKFQDIQSYCVGIKDIFQPGIECLQQYISNEKGIHGLPDDKRKECLECLISFLDSKEKHLKCLIPFMDLDEEDHQPPNKMKEPIYTFLLAEHLFSQLIPGHGYFLDKHHFPNDLTLCPGKSCKGSTAIHFNKPTGIGNKNVWHGYADIWLDKSNIPVTVVLEDTEDSDQTEDSEHISDSEVPSTQAERGMKVEQPYKNLITNDSVSQTVAQTIVNSFIQSRSGFVPTLCTTYGYLMIYMYDCENDIFLMSSPKFPLSFFKDEDFVDINVIFLWMILNYEIFSAKPSEKFLKFCKENDLLSEFPRLVGNKLKIYKEKLVKNVSSFTSVKEKMWPDDMPQMIPF